MISCWYLTPHILHLITYFTSLLCWKNCGCSATYIHVWWTCPVISIFWKHVLACIKHITGITAPFHFDTVLLGYWPSAYDSTPHRDLLQLLLATARLSIAHHWKNPTPPRISFWHWKVLDLLIISKITGQLSPPLPSEDGISYYDALWFPVTSHILANPSVWGVSCSLQHFIL